MKFPEQITDLSAKLLVAVRNQRDRAMAENDVLRERLAKERRGNRTWQRACDIWAACSEVQSEAQQATQKELAEFKAIVDKYRTLLDQERHLSDVLKAQCDKALEDATWWSKRSQEHETRIRRALEALNG